MGWVSGRDMICSVGRKDWTEPVGGNRKGNDIHVHVVMLCPVWRVGRTDETKWAGPVNGIIDQESDMEIWKEWAGRVGLNGQESD